MRYLVTGGTGFIGAYFLRRLCAEVEPGNIAVLTRPQSNTWRIKDLVGQLVRITGDIADPRPAADAIAEFAPDVVVHLAWGGVGNRFRNDVMQVDENLFGSLALLRIAERAGCKSWIGLGSQAEYGPLNRKIDEEAPTRPTTLYGVTKLCTCLLSQSLCAGFGLRFAWLRLFSSYGPMDDAAWMIPQLILKLLRGERPALTAGTQLWDYLYAADVAEAIYAVATNPDASGIYNLGSGETHTVRSVVETIRDLIDPALQLGFGDVPFRPDQTMHLEADIQRLGEATGWRPRVSLPDGLARTVEWYREHQDEYGPGSR